MKRLLTTVLIGLTLLAAEPVSGSKIAADRVSDSVSSFDIMVTQIIDVEELAFFNNIPSSNSYDTVFEASQIEHFWIPFSIKEIGSSRKALTNYPLKNSPLSSDASRMLLLGVGLIAIARIGRKRVLK